MTWTVSRNNHIDSTVSNVIRTRQTLCLIKDRLKAATVPWTVVSSGTGTGGSYGSGDNLPTFPSTSGMNDYAWVCLENVDGVQIVLQVDNYELHLWVSVDGGYDTAGDESEVLRPGNASPPATEVQNYDPGDVNWGGSAPHYLSIAIEDDGKSFIVFGKDGVYASFAMAIIRCVTIAGDLHPYWGLNHAYASNNPWDAGIWQGSSPPNTRMGYHPSGGAQMYQVADYEILNTTPMDNMPVNPYDGNEQLMGLVAICGQAPYKHVRGGLIGIMRCPSLLSTGDKLNSGELICMYEFAVPWGSAAESLL